MFIAVAFRENRCWGDGCEWEEWEEWEERGLTFHI